jgi:hypothetical protein
MWLERLTANALVEMVLSSIPASVGTVTAEEAVLNIVQNKNKKSPQKIKKNLKNKN